MFGFKLQLCFLFVLVTICSLSAGQTEECGENEELYGCIPTCNNTCENYNQLMPCALICIHGCDCRTGLVRRSDGQCVTPSNCSGDAK